MYRRATRHWWHHTLLWLACVLGLAAGPTLAETPAPGSVAGGEIILTVQNASGGVTTFDLAALDALPQQEVTTSTIWTEGVKTFSGPSLASVLAVAGVEQTEVMATAGNGYQAKVNVDAANGDLPVIASRIDGETFSRREKGPLWVIFPYDLDARYRTPLAYEQSIWQLVGLVATVSD